MQICQSIFLPELSIVSHWEAQFPVLSADSFPQRRPLEQTHHHGGAHHFASHDTFPCLGPNVPPVSRICIQECVGAVIMFSAAWGQDCTGGYRRELEELVYNERCVVEKTILRDHLCIVYLGGVQLIPARLDFSETGHMTVSCVFMFMSPVTPVSNPLSFTPGVPQTHQLHQFPQARCLSRDHCTWEDGKISTHF